MSTTAANSPTPRPASPVPTPLRARWRRFRTRGLPGLVFGLTVLGIAALWPAPEAEHETQPARELATTPAPTLPVVVTGGTNAPAGDGGFLEAGGPAAWPGAARGKGRAGYFPRSLRERGEVSAQAGRPLTRW